VNSGSVADEALGSHPDRAGFMHVLSHKLHPRHDRSDGKYASVTKDTLQECIH
jgi:hypothetical protein